MNNPEGFLVKRLTTVDEVLANWDFLLAGLVDLNAQNRPGHVVTAEAFLRRVLDTINIGSERGLVFIIESKNQKPLFYGVVFDNSSNYHPPSIVYYAASSNGKSATVGKFSVAYVEEWARAQGFKELHWFNSRFSGSSINAIERKFGVKRRMILYTKEL